MTEMNNKQWVQFVCWSRTNQQPRWEQPQLPFIQSLELLEDLSIIMSHFHARLFFIAKRSKKQWSMWSSVHCNGQASVGSNYNGCLKYVATDYSMFDVAAKLVSILRLIQSYMVCRNLHEVNDGVFFRSCIDTYQLHAYLCIVLNAQIYPKYKFAGA
jgi:hypothetical protein